MPRGQAAGGICAFGSLTTPTQSSGERVNKDKTNQTKTARIEPHKERVVAPRLTLENKDIKTLFALTVSLFNLARAARSANAPVVSIRALLA
jgi:hypothetical protein